MTPDTIQTYHQYILKKTDFFAQGLEKCVENIVTVCFLMEV